MQIFWEWPRDGKYQYSIECLSGIPKLQFLGFTNQEILNIRECCPLSICRNGSQEQTRIMFKGYAIVLPAMKTLSCRDAGCDCDYIAKGETEEDVMKDAAQHGMKEHGKTEQDMNQMKDNLRGAIRTS